MRHVETIKLPERWPEEYYKDDNGYYRVFYKQWWDESKSQLKSYTAYGVGHENLREAWVNKTWDRNGNPIYVHTFKRDENGKGQRHGIFEEWYPGGQKKIESVYVNDHQRSSKWWNRKGVLKSESIDSGTAAWEKTYYDNGTPSEERNYGYDMENGWRLEHGVTKWYRKNGTLSSESNYVNGKLDGTMVRYDKQGRKREMYTFKKGKKNGPHRVWDENGLLVTEINYKNDDLDGVAKHYRDGKLVSEVGYKNDEYHGDFKEYRPNGTLKSHHVYENGKLVKTIKDSWF